MHPRAFLDGLWRNDLADEVFVAMSFDAAYESRWVEIFKPAVEDLPLAGRALKAVRVDTRRSGESILTEIVSGISHCQLVLADVSVTDRWMQGGTERWCRNGNVMYEVGLALACRQPVEVILVRDDSEQLLFDITHIPVVPIDPTNAIGSVAKLRAVLGDRLRERSIQKDLRFARTMETLAQFEINLIRQNSHLVHLGWKGPSYPPAVAMALPALLNKGILRLEKLQIAEQPDVYTWTTLGRAIADSMRARPESSTSK